MIKVPEACPVCQGTRFRQDYNYLDGSLKRLTAIDFRCLTCGHIWKVEAEDDN